MALGSTQPLTEMSPKNISCGKGGRCVGLTTLPPSCADCLEIWEPEPPGTSGPVQACNGIALPFSSQMSQYPCSFLAKHSAPVLFLICHSSVDPAFELENVLLGRNM